MLSGYRKTKNSSVAILITSENGVDEQEEKVIFTKNENVSYRKNLRVEPL